MRPDVCAITWCMRAASDSQHQVLHAVRVRGKAKDARRCGCGCKGTPSVFCAGNAAKSWCIPARLIGVRAGLSEELWQDAACALCTCECNGSGTLCSSRGLHAPAPRRGLRVQRHVRSVALSGSRKGDIFSSSNARPRNFLKLTKAAGRQRRAYQ